MPAFLFKISGRLYAGFGALVLFGIGLAAFATFQLWAIEGQVAIMGRQATTNVRTLQISSELHAVRRAILRYTFDQDAESLTESEKRLATVSGMIETAIKGTTSEERRTAFAALARGGADIKAKRTALSEGIQQMSAGKALLQSSGDKMSAVLEKFLKTADDTPWNYLRGALDDKIL